MKLFMTVTVLVGITLPFVLLSRKQELINRWLVWLGISVVLLLSELGQFFGLIWILIFMICGFEAQRLTFAAIERGTLKRGVAIASWVVLTPIVLANAWALTSFIAQSQTNKVFFVVAIVDIGGWLGGQVLGRSGPLSLMVFPSISPNKTLAGVLVGIILGGAAYQWLELPRAYMFVAVATLAIFGDLVESKLKRLAGADVSGNSMPGFGGFLDRFDSVLFIGLLLPLIWV